MTSPWPNHFRCLKHLEKRLLSSRAGLILSPKTVPNVSVYGPDHHFQGKGWTLRDVTSLSCILWSVSVVQSGGLSLEIGVLYLSHALLVLAELIVCSPNGLACILAKWFWPTVMSFSLTYGSPESSCNKRADTYFEIRSASLMKEFWTLCIFGDDSFRNSYGRNNPIFEYWSCTLFVDL